MEHKLYINQLIANYQNDLDSIPDEWIISPKLKDKITLEGGFNHFPGSTSVIPLNQQNIDECKSMMKRVVDKNVDLVLLDPNTYHLTIHSYCNTYNVDGGNDMISAKMKQIEQDVIDLFYRINKKYSNEIISFESLGPSTSGSDVISIKFIPASEKDTNILLDIFEMSEEVYPLGKSFTPHVSLGYFKLKQYTTDEINHIYKNLIREKTSKKVILNLRVADIVYQMHHGMNDFIDLFTVGEST